MHVRASGNERNERAGEIVKFSEHDKHRSVFGDLGLKNAFLGFADAERVTVVVYERVTVAFAKIVSYPVSDNGSSRCEYEDSRQMIPPEKSSHQKHDLLSGNEHSYCRERLDNARSENNEVIPIPDMFDTLFYPGDKGSEQVRSEQRYAEESDEKSRNKKI